jgi:ATP-dependent protease ClpP protease subunit
MIDSKKTLSSEQHTLYIESVNEQKKIIDKAKGIYEISPKYKRYRVYIGRFRELRKGLHSVFNELREAKTNDYLELMISSSGGAVLEGQQFYNLIQDKFYGRTVAYLNNHGYSMGALLFCMADKRIIYEYSELMFHNYSGGAIGKGGDLKARIEHYGKTMDTFFYDIIVKKGFLKKDEFEQMLVGQDYWMEAKELCKRGIATHVILKGEEITAKEYLKVLKDRKKEKKRN